MGVECDVGGATKLQLGRTANAGCDGRAMISMTEGQPIPGFSDAVREAFSRKGVLAKSRDFEYRPQQQELAVAVAEALIGASPLVAEAGTGVGINYELKPESRCLLLRQITAFFFKTVF